MADKELFGNSEQLNDLISRQAAIDALKMDISIIPFAKAREYVREAIETIYNRLEELPSAEPEVRTQMSSADCISRKAAIEILAFGEKYFRHLVDDIHVDGYEREKCEWGIYLIETYIAGMKELPSAQPEIIYCKDCVKHNKGHGYYLDGTVIGIKDCCPLVEIRGMAKGHEFDYQYCAYAERRTDE